MVKATSSTEQPTLRTQDNRIAAGMSRARGDGKFGPGVSWELLRLNVITDKTDDTEPVWITATFTSAKRLCLLARGTRKASSTTSTRCSSGGFTTSRRHRKGRSSPTRSRSERPLQKAASSCPVQAATSSFTWVRTYKEFQRRHLDLANHADIIADFLAAATAGHGQEHNKHPEHRQSPRPVHPGPDRDISRVHVRTRAPTTTYGPVLDHPGHPHLRPGRDRPVRRIKARGRQHTSWR